MIPKLFQNLEYTNLINFINIIKLQMEELRLNFVKWFQRANIQTQNVLLKQKTIEGKPAPAKQFHKSETENVGSELKMLVK